MRHSTFKLLGLTTIIILLGVGCSLVKPKTSSSLPEGFILQKNEKMPANFGDVTADKIVFPGKYFTLFYSLIFTEPGEGGLCDTPKMASTGRHFQNFRAFGPKV